MFYEAVIWTHGMDLSLLENIPNAVVYYWHRPVQPVSSVLWRIDSAKIKAKTVTVYSENEGQVYNQIIKEVFSAYAFNPEIEGLLIYEGKWLNKVNFDELQAGFDSRKLNTFDPITNTDLEIDTLPGYSYAVDCGIAATAITIEELLRVGFIDPSSETPLAPYWSLQLTARDGEANGNQVKLSNHQHEWHPYGSTKAITPFEVGIPLKWLHNHPLVVSALQDPTD